MVARSIYLQLVDFIDQLVGYRRINVPYIHIHALILWEWQIMTFIYKHFIAFLRIKCMFWHMSRVR